MIPEYKSNSHKSKEETTEVVKTQVSKVTSGTAKKKQKSEIEKVTSLFVAEDVSSVKNYIVEEVLMPAAKKALSDVVTTGVDALSDMVRNGMDMFIYGEVRSKSRSKGSKVSYTGYYRDRDTDRKPSRERNSESSRRRTRNGYDYEDIIFETRGDAEQVLDNMFELLDRYEVVSVGDLYDLAGLSGNYIDNKYGWTGLRNADVQRTREGYILNLPRVVEL